MKKYLSILAVAAMAACATSAFAQGTVVFANGTGIVQQWTSATDQTLISVPKNGAWVELYWAPQNTAYAAWNPNLDPLGAAFLAQTGWHLEATPVGFTTPAAGKFNGGTLTLTGAAAGSSIDYVVVGWTGSATSFGAAIQAGALAGTSAKFTSLTGGVGVPATPAVNLNASFGGMTLVGQVPEPSTLALAGLGAAALLIFRRRN